MKVLNTEYFKNIFNQAVLVLIAQLIPIVLSPIITRLYDENAVAEITGLVSFSSILLVFSSLKIENAIVLENDNSKAKEVVLLTMALSVIYAIISIVIVLVFQDQIAKIFKVTRIIKYIPLYILSYSLLNILNFWFVRLKKFKLKAYSKLIESIFYVIILCLLYSVIGKNQYGLAFGKIFGVLIAFLTLFKYSKIKIKRVPIVNLKKLLIKYKEFPIHNAPSNLINVIGLQLLIVFIGAYFSKENFGFFGLANMVILIPISFISQSVGSIFFQKISENFILKKYSFVKKTFYQTLIMLLIIAVPIYIIIYSFSEQLFVFVYGENWLMSGKIAKMLALVFLFQMTVSPLGVFLIAINKVKVNAYWQYGRFIFMGVVMYILLNQIKVPFLSFIYFYSFAVAFVYIAYLIIMIVELNKLQELQ